ncbi:hypothetical protein PPL_00113 [Heterostelium album PN500]|uniref:Uncharacterized protein n=1 Tax=Heterostelium pallidum (strain ATCC 26659 / Pp 5 / PN500) TaxID=670386 RepID=D3AVK0_HETP5|nr:hypothetical protein PPL_00113 [Heterostelium album PN500]EFA86323.1 hypothetical protein PPL_00113 [Heterostelium album PN500]|eukprot:XP_020438428.1 hypothetical protein PPL_00113 [Heterostelium album PN500]
MPDKHLDKVFVETCNSHSPRLSVMVEQLQN